MAIQDQARRPCQKSKKSFPYRCAIVPPALSKTFLLCLLHWALRTREPVDIRGLDGLPKNAFDSLPSLANDRGGILSVGEAVDPGTDVSERALNKGALSVPGTEEDGISDKQDPGAFLEGDGGAKKASPESDFQNGHHRHAAVVVILNEATNCVCEGRVGLWLSRRSSRGCGGGVSRRRRDSRQQIGARVGGNMEQRINCKREDGERHLVGKQPYESHRQILHILISNDGQWPTLALARPSACAEALVNDDSIRHSCGNKGGAVGETGPLGGGIEGDVGQAISDGAKEQRDVTSEPGELKRLGELKQSLLKGSSLSWRRRGHYVES